MITTYPLCLHCSPQALCLVFFLDQRSVHWMRSTPCLGGKMGWDESKTWNRSKQTRVSALSVFRDCLAVKTWNAELSPVPKSNWAPLYPLVCLCVHAWPAALLPQTTMCYDHAAIGNAGSTAECSLTASCSQSRYSYRRRRQHVHEMCVRVSSPL